MTNDKTTRSARAASWQLRETDILIDRLYDESEGEETPEIEALEADREIHRDEALAALASYTQSQAGWLATLDSEAKRIAEAKASAKRKAEWARAEILRLLAGDKGAQVEGYKIATRAGRKSVSIDPDLAVESLPEAFRRVRIDADKTAISKALKDGQEIEGCALVTGPRSVSIK